MLRIWLALLSIQLCKINLSEALTKDIKKCRFGDSACLVDTMNAVIKGYPRGIPSIGLRPIDVVDVNNTEIWNNAEVGGVWFKFKLFEQVNYGFENTTITQVKGFGKDPTATYMEIRGQMPSLIHKGKYLANGRVWLIELNATGESVSDFQNFNFALKLKVIMEYRNNKRYLKIYELVPRVTMSRWILWLEDFFHENTDLTIAVNQVFNANWVEFWNELEPSILEVFRGVFTYLIGDIFNKIPYDDLFLEDGTKTM